ncbi:MAG: uridylate kinase, partial [Betaproteobacteria bacterium HGW-Betaproteobacteria-20]
YITGQKYQTWVVNKAEYKLFKDGFSVQKLEEAGLLVNAVLN